MNIDWKALKKQKQEELPAAEKKHREYIEHLVQTYEKRLYLHCKDQVAGKSEVYDPRYLDDSFSVWWQILDHFFLLNEVVEMEPHVEAMKILCAKLRDENVNCSLLNSNTEICITLP